MGQVLVRNLDDRVIESLRAKAELKGCSLEQELRDVLTKAAPLTPEEKIALFRKLRAMTPPLEDVDVRAAIRRGRDVRGPVVDPASIAQRHDWFARRWGAAGEQWGHQPAVTDRLGQSRICRKSWLFAGSDRGGGRAAVMLTLIQTAKLNNIDPQA